MGDDSEAGWWPDRAKPGDIQTAGQATDPMQCRPRRYTADCGQSPQLLAQQWSVTQQRVDFGTARPFGACPVLLNLNRSNRPVRAGWGGRAQS